MPERSERFFWVYAKHPSREVASRLDEAHSEFARSWRSCNVKYYSCVAHAEPSTNKVWLFALQCRRDGDTATSFNKVLNDHLERLPKQLRTTDLLVKRRSNLPTPLIEEPLNHGWRTDFGLHAVNDEYNGMLVTYTYHVGRFMMPPHFQTASLRRVYHAIRRNWRKHSCDCRSLDCSACAGDGCYDCFGLRCALCKGTGWKSYGQWAAGGYRIDYESGYPLAVVAS